jgi:hypothetical protein
MDKITEYRWVRAGDEMLRDGHLYPVEQMRRRDGLVVLWLHGYGKIVCRPDSICAFRRPKRTAARKSLPPVSISLSPEDREWLASAAAGGQKAGDIITAALHDYQRKARRRRIRLPWGRRLTTAKEQHST